MIQITAQQKRQIEPVNIGDIQESMKITDSSDFILSINKPSFFKRILSWFKRLFRLEKNTGKIYVHKVRRGR